MISNSIEYEMIQDFYGVRVANRTGVPLINHIDEGLVILREINASEDAMKAFCIHPLLQDDNDLAVGLHHVVAEEVSPRALALALEYRSVANEYLSEKTDVPGREIRLSPLQEVNQMLIADKVQNRKDFIEYHLGTHPNSDKLNRYFLYWLQELGIDEEKYQNLCSAIRECKQQQERTKYNAMKEKVDLYENLMHKIQLCSVTGHNSKIQVIVATICRWSYAHRSGNGELSEEEESARIQAYLDEFKQLIKDQ
jgi:hypothetical protein